MQYGLETTFFFVIIWVASGVHKVLRPDETRYFLSFLLKGKVMSATLSATFSRLVGLLELLVGVTLLIQAQIGAGVSALLLLVYTAAVVRVLRAGGTVVCGCGGILGSHPVSRYHVARNLLLLALNLTGFVLLKLPIDRASVTQLTLALAGAAAIAAANAAAGEVYVALVEARA